MLGIISILQYIKNKHSFARPTKCQDDNPLSFWGEDNGNPLLFSVIVGVEQ